MTGTVRPGVAELVALGRMPADGQADSDPARSDRWETLVGELYAQGAVTDGEAASLVQLFPVDDSDSHGVAWTLPHVIESAPGWPLDHAWEQADGPWACMLRQRRPNAPAES